MSCVRSFTSPLDQIFSREENIARLVYQGFFSFPLCTAAGPNETRQAAGNKKMENGENEEDGNMIDEKIVLF